ncbi:MAG: thioredoxin family protein [Myxococcales bacterium]|nr:thioredoxin family protein [Myxococcales bacterium]
MVRTPSTMAPLGSRAPDFSLYDVRDGAIVTRDGAKGPKGLLVMFLCNHCPYVKHVRTALAEFGREYQDRGLGMVAISSNDADAYPDDGPDRMRQEARDAGYVFPYCFDETQEVAKAYQAACTPDLFLYDPTLRLVYRGQLDETRPNGGKPATGRDLRAAADALIAGRAPVPDQIASIGCNIKWKPGNEPE